LRRRLEGAVRSLFWNSKAGAWFARMLTPSGNVAAAETAYRPTEVALGLAVDDLFDSLPKLYQRQLASLPATVRELESHAADARRRLDELTSAQLRDKAKQELAEAVTVLESIRLDLLRLHGGASDLAPLTSVLERAQQLGEELQALQEGQARVDAELGMSTPV
jgi:serine/threonine-protein kinase